MNETKHTPLPWRVGDAGRTVFGPPNGNPSPETVANVRFADNARFIVQACNSFEDLIETLEECLTDEGAACLAHDDKEMMRARIGRITWIAQVALKKARGKKK